MATSEHNKDMIIDLTRDPSDIDEGPKDDENEVIVFMSEDKDKSSGDEDAGDAEDEDDDEDDANEDKDDENEVIVFMSEDKDKSSGDEDAGDAEDEDDDEDDTNEDKDDENEVIVFMSEDKDKSSGDEDAGDAGEEEDEEEDDANEDKDEETNNAGNLRERTHVRNDALIAAAADLANCVSSNVQEMLGRLGKDCEEEYRAKKRRCGIAATYKMPVADAGKSTSQSRSSNARSPWTTTDDSRKKSLTLEDRFTMPKQGLHESSVSMQMEGVEIGTGTEDTMLPDETAKFDGKVFRKGKCYRVGACVIGILGFFPDDRAKCVSVVPVEETLLETIPDRDGLSPLSSCIGKYVQYKPHKEHLADLVKAEEEERISLPTYAYAPRDPRSGVLFGYVNTKNQPKRQGRRMSSPRAADMFSSAGLFSHALTECGFNLVMGVEKDEDAAMSFEALHSCPNNDDGEIRRGQTVVYQCTMKEFLSRCEKDHAFKQSIGQLQYIHLSPPCQGFSKQNRLGGVNDEENNEASLTILKVVQLFRPPIVTFENVTGIWTNDHICRYIKPIVYGLIAEGYDVSAAILNACDFGDPQIRPRFFLMAAAPCVPLPCFPSKSHGPPNSGLLPHVTLSDELGPYEDSYPEQKQLLKRRDQDALADPSKPATSVLASKRLVHYCKNRHYSLEENALLMSHDPQIVQKMQGDDKSKQRMIGNGIPKGVGMALGRQVFEILKFVWKGEDEWYAGSSRSSNDESPPA